MMEQTEEEPQVLVKPKTPFFLSAKFLAGSGILFLVLVAVLLNYTFFKKPFKPQPSPTPEIAKIIIPCPTDAAFCKNVQPIIKDRYLALGANVDSDSPIFAVFDGKAIKRTVILPKASDQENIIQVSLINEQQKLKALYYFKGQAIIKSSFQKGELIALIPQNPIKYYNNYNFVFTILNVNNEEVPFERIVFQ